MKNKYDLLRPVQIIIIATWFSGCTSLPYLHSNETEIETQAIKEAAANIKVDQNFDEIKKQLVAFANREDKSITDYLISKRDIQLARLVRDDRLNKDKTSAISLLQTFIDERFKKITQDYEIKIPEGKDELYRFMFLPDLLYRIQVTLKSELATYHYALQDFTDSRKNDNDKRSTDCNEVPNSKLLLEQNAKEIAYKRLVMACERIKTIYASKPFSV